MTKHIKVAILGAGTAGLNALSQVRRETDSFLLIDGHEELGTTCARVGCMPSKALIHIAETFHGRNKFSKLGIQGEPRLKLDSAAVMERVQDVRDILVDRVLSHSIDLLGDKFINEYAHFIDANTLQVGDQTITADKIILAVGSRPIVPKAWQSFGNQLLTTDTFFEQENLPKSIAVIGLGVIGLELGQAMGQLGVNVTGFDALTTLAGIEDPKINQCLLGLVKKDLAIHLGQTAELKKSDDLIQVRTDNVEILVERVLVSIGRQSNVDQLHMQNTKISLDDKGLPNFNLHTMALDQAPHIFIAGDVNLYFPILHEAAYEGKIAGLNSVAKKPKAFKRYVPLHITFCEPTVCQVGQSLNQLDADEIVIGDFTMGPHGRALVMANNFGLVHLYADKNNGKLLGACMVAPRAEHLAHLLAWSIEQGLYLQDLLRYPFYHPTFEEALQGAIRKALSQLPEQGDLPPELTLLSN